MVLAALETPAGTSGAWSASEPPWEALTRFRGIAVRQATEGLWTLLDGQEPRQHPQRSSLASGELHRPWTIRGGGVPIIHYVITGEGVKSGCLWARTSRLIAQPT
jgi:hypothetical protein